MHRVYTNSGVTCKAYQFQDVFSFMLQNPTQSRWPSKQFKISYDETTCGAADPKIRVEIVTRDRWPTQVFFMNRYDYLLHFMENDPDDDHFAAIPKAAYKLLFSTSLSDEIESPDPEIKLIHDIDNGKYNQARDDSRGSYCSPENGSTVTDAV